jgi:hypothetical protein
MAGFDDARCAGAPGASQVLGGVAVAADESWAMVEGVVMENSVLGLMKAFRFCPRELASKLHEPYFRRRPLGQ